MTSLNRDRVVINFQKMQDLQSKTFTLGGYFRDGAESALRSTLVWEGKCMVFVRKKKVFGLIWHDLE